MFLGYSCKKCGFATQTSPSVPTVTSKPVQFRHIAGKRGEDSMFGVWQQLPSTVPRRSAMRAVIADFDAARRGFLRGVMMVEGSFELVGVAETSEECVSVVANEQPELIICNAAYANLVPQTDPPFPLVIPIACPPGGMPNP